MKKALVMQITKYKTILMCQNGEFVEIRRKKNHAVGATVFFRETANLSYQKFIANVAAAVVVFVLSGFGMYYTPVRAIDIDVKSSVRLSINMFDKVIDVKPLNSYGAALLNNKSSEIKNCNVKDGIEKVINEAKVQGYLKDEDKINVSVYGDTAAKVEYQKQKVKSDTHNVVNKNNIKSEVVVIGKNESEINKSNSDSSVADGKGSGVINNNTSISAPTNKPEKAAVAVATTVTTVSPTQNSGGNRRWLPNAVFTPRALETQRPRPTIEPRATLTPAPVPTPQPRPTLQPRPTREPRREGWAQQHNEAEQSTTNED